MSKYRQFIFADYNFLETEKKLTLTYRFDDEISFSERYFFDFPFEPKADKAALDKSIQSLFFMAGVSYFKAYLPSEIVINKGELDQEGADFFSKTYQKGLGEFFYVNKLDPNTPIRFPHNLTSPEPPVSTSSFSGQLIGIGGGKDSLVSAELLKAQPHAATWSVDHRDQLEPLVQEIGLPHFWVQREWDRSLLEHNAKGAYNGHVPISAILACVGVIVGILTGHRDIVVSNESSASEPNLEYNGAPINHQYSKSLEFEQDFQKYLKHLFGNSVRYYSLLRPLTEVKICELFAKNGFDKYKDVFSSCNRAFVHTSDHIFWCGECPKCTFVFLALTPFVPREKLEELWGGKNLLLEPSLEKTYRQLLGIEDNKPLECVGEIKEARAAMRLAQKIYPELSKYEFELPSDYDFRALSEHSMPEDVAKLFSSVLLRG
jgi:hypothetical protein